MKTLHLLKLTLFFAASMMLAQSAIGQYTRPQLQYFRPNDARGLNMFETPKEDTVGFDGVKVRVGGDFAVVFQGISQENDLVGDTLVELSNNLALPTANLNLDVQLMDGVRLHLRTYLSSRHHPEAWVKGGYLQMDKLDFISPGFLSGLMDITTIRVGMDEINYGDAHFRRSDNARSIYNPFVGNYIMDAFTTEPFIEFTFQPADFLIVAGVSNGRLNQSPTAGDDGIVFFGKLGYDSQISDDFRLRLTGSMYTSSDRSTRDYLYNGDRAGARYYSVLEGENDARVSDFEPRFNPGFPSQTAFQFNPFIKYRGLEFFGILETTSNGDSDIGGGFNQTAAEVIYRFGTREQIFLGARYNAISGEFAEDTDEININRFNIGGGWFMSKNVVAKLEYVTSSYGGDGYDGTKYQGANFNGFVIEAAISF